LDRITREYFLNVGSGELNVLMFAISSAKSALHGLVHWLANTYAKKGITVNGIAPALIQDTKMLPGSNDELSKSRFKCKCTRNT
jgi:NAD(P)-dependent dehydrogenase (short-subunit alcohol dehydrogenase family)